MGTITKVKSVFVAIALLLMFNIPFVFAQESGGEGGEQEGNCAVSMFRLDGQTLHIVADGNGLGDLLMAEWRCVGGGGRTSRDRESLEKFGHRSGKAGQGQGMHFCGCHWHDFVFYDISSGITATRTRGFPI